MIRRLTSRAISKYFAQRIRTLLISWPAFTVPSLTMDLRSVLRLISFHLMSYKTIILDLFDVISFKCARLWHTLTVETRGMIVYFQPLIGQ